MLIGNTPELYGNVQSYVTCSKPFSPVNSILREFSSALMASIEQVKQCAPDVKAKLVHTFSGCGSG